MEDGKKDAPKEKDALNNIKKKLEENLGERSGMEDLYYDDKYNNFLKQMAETGAMLNLGKVRVGYLDGGEDTDLILMPGSETIVLKINQKSPRDRVIQLLSG